MEAIQTEANRRQQSALETPSQTANCFTVASDAKAYLNNAEFRAQARMKWPDKLNRFPFNLSPRLQGAVLKGIRLLFRDQQEVNLNLINALRQSLMLQQQLIHKLEGLQMDARAQQAEILVLQRTIEQLRSQE
ncbi:MAG: hypothetical protein HC824_09235 [Synechococcales cyanobacterium RM1_1_8]|nr:hypothetical protein [Synechococcales cyanobacterium RM1_1_8]